MNRKMRLLLGSNAATPERLVSSVPLELQRELEDGFQEISGCVLPFDPTVKTNNVELDQGEDETAVECQLSKVNFRDYAPKGFSFDDMLRMGLSYVFALKVQLAKSGLKGPFRVILGADAEGDYPSVTVRYHRLRVGQEWLAENLEGYSDAILFIDF